MSAAPDFDVLYARHYGMVRQLCLGYVAGDAHAADDLAQETFVNVWRGLGGYAGAASAKTWIYRIAVNTCLRELRRRARRPTTTPTDAEPVAAPSAVDPRLARLYAALAQLPDVDRLIYVLTLEGQTRAEIAAITGLSPEALRVRIHRANARLRQLVKQP